MNDKQNRICDLILRFLVERGSVLIMDTNRNSSSVCFLEGVSPD